MLLGQIFLSHLPEWELDGSVNVPSEQWHETNMGTDGTIETTVGTSLIPAVMVSYWVLYQFCRTWNCMKFLPVSASWYIAAYKENYENPAILHTSIPVRQYQGKVNLNREGFKHKTFFLVWNYTQAMFPPIRALFLTKHLNSPCSCHFLNVSVIFLWGPPIKVCVSAMSCATLTVLWIFTLCIEWVIACPRHDIMIPVVRLMWRVT